MSLDLIVRGAIIGFSVAAPIGPISVLIVRRTLAGGAISGLLSALGAATADILYGCIAGFGLVQLASFLVDQQGWLRLVGGAFLIYLGARAFLAEPLPIAQPSDRRRMGLAGDYGSTFFLTLTNPFTIVAFGAIFAGLGLGERAGDYEAAGSLVAGVFLGSMTASVGLTVVTALLRGRFGPRGLRWMNRSSGMIVASFGLAALVSARF